MGSVLTRSIFSVSFFSIFPKFLYFPRGKNQEKPKFRENTDPPPPLKTSLFKIGTLTEDCVLFRYDVFSSPWLSHLFFEEIEPHGQHDGQHQQARHQPGTAGVRLVDEEGLVGHDEPGAVQDGVLVGRHEGKVPEVCSFVVHDGTKKARAQKKERCVLRGCQRGWVGGVNVRLMT